MRYDGPAGMVLDLVGPSPGGVDLEYAHPYSKAKPLRNYSRRFIYENSYVYARNNPVRYVDPSGRSVIDDINSILEAAERRRDHGPWAGSAQHCWAACYIGAVYGLGNIAALLGDVGEIGSSLNSDWWRYIQANHYGSWKGNEYNWSKTLRCSKTSPQRYCDNACESWLD